MQFVASVVMSESEIKEGDRFEESEDDTDWDAYYINGLCPYCYTDLDYHPNHFADDDYEVCHCPVCGSEW